MPASALHAIQARTAIVIPCKDECMARIAGVWGAIPPSSLIVLVSGSSSPARFACERDALAAFCRLTGRRGLAVHQRDPVVAAALREAGMGALLVKREQQKQAVPIPEERGAGGGDGGLGEEAVRMGKGEGLVIGIALAATAKGPSRGATARGGCGRYGISGAARCGDDYQCGTACGNSDQRTFEEYGQQDEMMGCCCGAGGGGGCRQNRTRPRDTNAGGAPGYYKYIGFIDADNFVPVSVEEYCRAFSTGLYLAQAEDAMVRISWPSKPKVRNGKLEFSRSGRSSEIVNRWLNGLIGKMDGVSIETRAGAGVSARAGAVAAAVGTGGGDGDGYGAACAAEMMTGYEAAMVADNLICTGNAGEHAMTISLALKLRLASGYAIEPFHFLDIFERFAGPSVVGVDAAAAAAGITTANVAGIPTSKQQQQRHPGEKVDAADDFAADLLPSSPVSSPTALTALTSPVTTPTTPADGGSPALSACASASSSSASSRGSKPSPTNAFADLPPPPPLSPLCLSPTRGSSLGVVASKTVPPPPPARVQILQIRPLSPHFHENKGEAHVERMWKQGLSAVYYSPVTAAPGLARYREELRSTIFRGGDDEMRMKKKMKGDGGVHDGFGGDGPVSRLPTPPLSSTESGVTTPPSENGIGVRAGDGDGGGRDIVGDDGAAVLAAAGWKPEQCRVYPPAGSMRLEAFRARLEEGSGSFWWSEKAAVPEPTQSQSPSPGLLGFDSMAVLGLGPVSRERRPEGDVDGFRACVDDTGRR